MSWLNIIYENLINEISADLAYTRFYSGMSRDAFDAIVDGDPNPDKFIQFLLSNVRDGKASVEDAVEAHKMFKGSDQLVKNDVKNKFSRGEYNDVYELMGDIKYLASGDAILSKRKFYEAGYIKIKENENWLATCTTNYLANNHFFGASHWCTASDRQGRYDGYRMFLNYSYPDALLIQFTWKKKVKEEGGSSYTYTENYKNFSREQGVITDEIEWPDHMFQVQVNKNGSIGQICNFMDRTCYTDALSQMVGEDMFSILKDRDILKKLDEIMLSQGKKEQKYQEAVDEVIAMKKRRKKELERQRRNIIQQQADEINNQKMQVIAREWQDFLANKKWEDPDFIKRILYNNRRRADDNITDEDFSAANHVVFVNRTRTTDGKVIVKLGCCLGIAAYVNVDYNDDTDEETYSLGYGDNTENIESIADRAIFLLFDPSNVDDTLKTIGVYEGQTRLYVLSPSTVDDANDRRFYVLDNHQIEGFGMYDARYDRTFKMPTEVNGHIRAGDGKVLFFNTEADLHFYYTYYERTGELERTELPNGVIRIVDYGEGISIMLKDKNVQYLFAPERGIVGMEIPSALPLRSFSNRGNRGAESNIVMLYFDDIWDKCNAIINGKKDFIFGFDAIDVYFDYDDEGNYVCCGVKHLGNDENRAVLYNNGEYKARVKVSYDGERYFKEIPCDREGVTIDEKNLANWKGYSDETKADMDKMWADRQKQIDANSPEENGQGALSAWRDEDNKLSPNQLKQRFINTTAIRGLDDKIDAGLDKLQPSDDWSGFVGVTDPYAKEMRDRPFYRIDRYGRPMDQPWYDEDEVPGRWTGEDEDTIARGLARTNRVNESLNKMKSIWDRMGLND